MSARAGKGTGFFSFSRVSIHGVHKAEVLRSREVVISKTIGHIFVNTRRLQESAELGAECGWLVIDIFGESG